MDSRPQIDMSSSLEDYLEAIAAIIETDKHAHTKDISEKLGVSMPSVSNALQALAARGMIIYKSHMPVTLTNEGAQCAAVITRRHQALKRFFSGLLAVDETVANKTACDIEHHIDDTVVARLVALLEAIDAPECEDLRARLAKLMPTIKIDPEPTSLIELDSMPKHTRGVVVKVSDTLKGLKKFANLGIVPGTLVEMEGHAPFGGLIRIKVMGASLSMRGSDASQIWIKPTE
ncbi:MAG: metal-dependent transcriptional regulator [Victivallaceae bacterium]|nr:metal-dependent transcriptional regulator [Victivallaceae bacterium]